MKKEYQTAQAPLSGKPVLVKSFEEYTQIFGSYLPNSYGEQRYLPYCVEQFFNNGGIHAYIMRVVYNEGSCINPSHYLGEDLGSGKRTGLAAFQEISNIRILCIPGITLPSIQAGLIAFCEERTSCMAILDTPFSATSVDDVISHRINFESSFGAMYHPWLGYFDALEKCNIYLPPSGIMAGIYARCDNERGVHKAPVNEVIRGCTSISCTYSEAEQDKLNLKGINLIRAIPGSGIRVWGARTMSSNTKWKYINVRRLHIFIEESIHARIAWAKFEPNDEILWNRIQSTIDIYLTSLWQRGELAGNTSDEAFYVHVNKDTMSQDDISNGRLICEIGIAPVRPKEFIKFKILRQAKKCGEKK